MVSCKATYCTIGMDEQTFLQQNRSARLVEASTQRTVYKITTQPFGAPARVMFYYFVNGKLAALDQGVRRADVTIETHNN